MLCRRGWSSWREAQWLLLKASNLTSQFYDAVQERVEQLARSLVAAKRNPKQASILLNNATVRGLIKQEDQLQMALGPMLHHGR